MKKVKNRKSKKQYQQKYRRSIDGFLTHLHHRMVNRTKGITTRSPELYAGLPVLSKQDFLEWVIFKDEGQKFNYLYRQWAALKFNRFLSPSIDRIDSSKGYVEGNIRWVTASENSQLVHQSRYSSQTSITT